MAMDDEFLNLDIINKVITSSAVANDLPIINRMTNVMKARILVFSTVCHCTSSTGRVNIKHLLFPFLSMCPTTSCIIALRVNLKEKILG